MHGWRYRRETISMGKKVSYMEGLGGVGLECVRGRHMEWKKGTI